MIFFKILKEHLYYLQTIFQLLDFKEIILSSKKSFLSYSFVILLRQKMNAFDFIVFNEKIVVIKSLDFFYKLFDLKFYLDLIEWLRKYVTHYAQKTKALQHRKIILLRAFSFNKERVRKIYNQKIVLKSSIVEKLNFYKQLQKFFERVEFLVHFDRNRILYIDIDVFKQRDFDAIIYHLKKDVNLEKSRKTNVKSILFLSRLLNFVETRY